MKIGLALCGGGLKGSYQVGAIKALLEQNIQFDIITGTSIGSINGLMLFQNEFNQLEKLWEKISFEDILKIGKDIKQFNLKEIISKKEHLKLVVGDYLKNFGIDILPFKTLLKENIHLNKMNKDHIQFGVVVTEFPSLRKKEVLLNDLDEETVFNYILASSSCFPFFPMHKIDNKSYIDGGYTDNLPIEFAFQLGSDVVYAIDLNYKVTHPVYLSHPHIVHYIYPKTDLGSFMAYDKKLLKKNSILGYFDALKCLKQYFGHLYTFHLEDLNQYCSLIERNGIDLRKFLIPYKESAKKSDRKFYELFIRHHFKNQNKMENADLFFLALEKIALPLKIDYTRVYSVLELIKIIRFTLEAKSPLKSDKILDLSQKNKNILKKIPEKEILVLFFKNDRYYNSKILEELLFYQKEIFPAVFLLKYLKKTENKQIEG